MLFFANILLISVLGFFSSYSDIRESRISNKIVFPMILFGVLLAVIAAADLALFSVNLLFAFVFGFALFLARLWSAADAKLFLAFSVLFPLSLYPRNFVFFPSFSLLLNSFVPAFVFLFVVAFAKTTLQQKSSALRDSLEPKTLVSLALVLFAFYWLIAYFFSLVAMPLDFFVIVLLLFFFISALEKVFPKRLVIFSAALSVFFALLRASDLLQYEFWFNFLFLFVSMFFLRFFILYLGFFAFGKRVEIADLKPGMVLLEGVYEKNGNLEKKKLFFPSLINAMQDIRTKYVFDLSAKGLTQNNIALIKEKNRAEKVRFHSLLVQETLPFAPLLFSGTILTFFCSLFLPWC